MQSWREKVDTVLVNWRPAIEALDRVLSDGFLGLDQSEPVENGSDIRFTIQLLTSPKEHHQPPEVFIPVTRVEFFQAGGTRSGLERILTRKIDQHIQKDDSGTWRARTVDGLRWKYDGRQERWIKDPNHGVGERA